MSNTSFKLNEKLLKLIMHLLSRLEKRIYLLRVSLYGENETFSSNIVQVPKEIIRQGDGYFKDKCSLSADEYKLVADSCEIETCIHRILQEMKNTKTFTSLNDIAVEFENESTTFKKHQKILRAKKKQIDQLKEVLSQEQSQVNVCSLNVETPAIAEKAEEKVDTFCKTEFLNKLMRHKVKSRSDYYDYKQANFQEKIEWFQREVRVQLHADAQTISFWLLKYDDCSEKLDILLKEIFDNWAKKTREYQILKKFRKMNLDRIQKLHKLMAEREEYIENYRIKKEKEQKEREEELRRNYAAIKIQACWRGTMVRKCLGPYKRKKPSKKGKKGKGKKKSAGKKKK